MASDPPQLDLNDLLLNIDSSLSSQPANGPLDASVAAVTGTGEVSRSMSPEPPDEQELFAMRLRALSIRDSKGKEREDSPGNELIEMVLRLTAAVPARAQILEQAAVIRRLSVQLDFLLTRMNDDRARWEAEKNCMQRVCEALILQANFASHNVYKDQDGARKPAILEAENTSLRQKLADTQSRANSLEAELAQLRPLLLMQPSAIASSKGLTLSPGKSGKKEEDGVVENVESRSYYRARVEKAAAATSSPKSKKKKATAYFKHAPTVADARSEHLLLAMRKLGKERATILSQSMYRTTDPSYPPGTTPNQNVSMHIKANGNQPRPMMSPAVWPAHLQPAVPTGQQTSQQSKPQQGQLAGSLSPAKGQQNPPFSQYGPPAGAHFQHYFVPSGSVPRPPGAPMPPPAFYHAGPPRGYIPGPAWPYYAPGPYAFGQPIPVQNPSRGINVSSSQPRPANSRPVAGPSRTPVLSASQSNSASPSTQGTGNANQSNVKSPRQGQQARGPRTPQSKSTSTPTNRNTPMDNLLSAAQSVFSPSAPPASGRDATPDNIGSPSPKKRRRVDQQDQAKNQSKGKQPVGNVDRRTSALDVLADQAAGVVPSAQPPGSGTVNRGAESALPSSASASQQSTDFGDVFIAGSSKASGGPSTNESMRRAPSVRKGKRRPGRASSTTPTSTVPSSSLAPLITTQRAASEDRAPSISSTSQVSIESFKLRPVQDKTFPDKNSTATRSARSGSLARNIGPPSKRGSSAAGRGLQPNGRALTPLGHGSNRRSRPISSRRPDVDAGEAEIESEDEPDVDTEVDQLNEDDMSLRRGTDAPVKAHAGINSGETHATGEDMNSRRWLEILGRKES
ncbi:hypothetical protein ACEPAI_5610 [Sanghuangporus weigelae]